MCACGVQADIHDCVYCVSHCVMLCVHPPGSEATSAQKQLQSTFYSGEFRALLAHVCVCVCECVSV